MQRAVFLRKSEQIGYQRHQLHALGNTPTGRLSSEAHPRTQLPDFHLRRQEAVVPPSAGSIRANRCRNAFDRGPNFDCCKSGLLHDSEHRTGVQNHARRRREGLLAQIPESKPATYLGLFVRRSVEPARSTTSCDHPDPVRWSVSAAKYSCSALPLRC